MIRILYFHLKLSMPLRDPFLYFCIYFIYPILEKIEPNTSDVGVNALNHLSYKSLTIFKQPCSKGMNRRPLSFIVFVSAQSVHGSAPESSTLQNTWPYPRLTIVLRRSRSLEQMRKEV